MHTMLTNLYCLKQDRLLCAYNISPHVAHCKMLIALLTSVYDYAAHPRSSITASSEDTDLVTADLEILLRKHHQLIMEYAVRPSSM